MKKLFYTLAITGLLSSCGNNSENNTQSINQQTINPQSTNQQRTNSQRDNKRILTETAFVKLDNYEYQDNTNGDFSGGSKDGRTIKIFGTTNFPNGTAIEIQTNGFIVSSKEGGMPDTYQEVKVEDGNFTGILKPWNITEEIEFRIFSTQQSNNVTDIIGKIGEKIKIDPSNKDQFPETVIFQSEDYKVNEDIIFKIKGGKKITYKFQKSSELNKPYEKSLAEFAKNWKDKDWIKMAKYCQVAESKSAQDLKTYFDLIDVLRFQVSSSKQGTTLLNGNITMEIEFTVDVKSSNGMKGIQKKKLKANVIQEDGKWGVNSTSVTRGLYD